MTAIPSWLLIWILAYSVSPSFCSNKQLPYTVSQIKTASGIFYQNLGQVKLSDESISLLSYINVTFYKTKFKIVSSAFDMSENLCKRCENHNGQQITCNKFVSQLRRLIDQIRGKFETISHLTEHTIRVSRERRGLIDGVSTGLKWLFGTPDANDAKYYSDAIRSLKDNKKDTIILMRQQIHLLTSAIESYNNSVISLQLNEEKLNENLKKFSIFGKNVMKSLDSIVSAQSTLSHFTLLTELGVELNQECETIISSILFGKQNILHPFVITPINLRNELLKIRVRNPENQLPMPLDKEFKIQKYYALSRISIIYDNDYLIFAIQIPVVKSENYFLYKLIPLPMPSHIPNVYSFINPSTPFLIMSATKTRYGQLDSLSSCQEISDAQRVCDSQTLFLTSQRPVCEARLRMEDLDHIPEDCETKTITASMEIWHRLSPTKWLFVVSQSTPLTVSCETDFSDALEINVMGTGIIELEPSCRGYTLSTTIRALHVSYYNYSNFLPQIDINFDDCCVANQKKLGTLNLEPIQIDNVNLDELRHAKHRLQKFDVALQDKLNESFPMTHLTTIGTIVAVLFIAMLLYCVFSKLLVNCSCPPCLRRLFQRRTLFFPSRRRQVNPDVQQTQISLSDLSSTTEDGARVDESHNINPEPVVCNPYNLRSRTPR